MWDLALMFPVQGSWSVDDYLRLDTGLLVEFTDGFIRVLPMPGLLHQRIVRFLFQVLNDHVNQRRLGEVFFAPLPIPLTQRKYREPDLVFLRSERITKIKGHPVGADLVIEVVGDSPEDRRRDYEEKRTDYAEARIAEYWIVDPAQRKLTVLALAGTGYREHGVFAEGDSASSACFPDFELPVSGLFARCNE